MDYNNGLNDGCERVCLRLWRGVQTHRGTAVAVLVFGRAGACPCPKSKDVFSRRWPKPARESAVSLNAANIGCGGGKFYTGFAPMPPFVPAFVSQKEHYKQTPEMVLEFIGRLGVPGLRCVAQFARIDTPQAAEAFGTADGALFFATPDILSGLVSWAVYDNNADDAVCALRVRMQRRRDAGRAGEPPGRTQRLLALFDPSVRPWVDASDWGSSRPMSRLREDVRHDACKLSFQDPCVEQGQVPH